MKIFSTDQIRAWDAYTIAHEPVSSVDLMNRAAATFADWFARLYPDTGRPVCVLAGTGNNGGDGVAVARLLHRQFYSVKVLVCAFSGKRSADFEAQLAALPPNDAIAVQWLNAPGDLPAIPPGDVVIDALFGSGLTRPLSGEWALLIDRVNLWPNEKVSIDLPSGLFADQATTGPCIRANRTFSFETPKFAFFFPENAGRVGEWACGRIGLHPEFDRQTETPFYFSTRSTVQPLLRARPVFSHKGTYGHALLVNGSMGKMGAAVLAARACLRSGVGLLTVHTPRCGYVILQTSVPEAMCSPDADPLCWSGVPPEPGRYTAIGAGCGIGADPKTAQALKRLIQSAGVPLVLDADALNLLAVHPRWHAFLPKNTIITPHPKEFERLFGPTANAIERSAVQRNMAHKLGIFIVLKGAYTAIACPDGSCWFNSTGNPGMATGGSGDVLTGLLTGLLAQGYAAREACLLGVYLHGLAGDLAAQALSQAGLTAGDIADYLAPAWLQLAASNGK